MRSLSPEPLELNLRPERGNEARVKIRGLLPLTLACIAHAGALAGLSAMKHPHTPIASPAATVSEIELEAALSNESQRPEELLSRPDSKSASPTSAYGGGSSAKLAARDHTPATITANPHDVPDTDPPPDGWSFSPLAVHIDTAFTPDYSKHESRPADPAPPAPVSTTGGVAEGLAARDLQAGVGRGGSILTAAEAAARSADAPLRGDATFDVVVRSDGNVDAHLASASGDADGWREVATLLQRSLDGHRVRVPPGARGVHVVVRVEAKVVLADGRDTQTLHGPRAAVAPSVLSNAMEGKPGALGSSEGDGTPPVGGALGPEKPTHVASTVLTGLVARILPTPTVSVEGKVCSAKLAITPFGVGLGGSCSFENIGNGTRRVVAGRIVREELL